MSITSIKIKHKNFDVDKIRADFPILKIKSNNNPLEIGYNFQLPKKYEKSRRLRTKFFLKNKEGRVFRRITRRFFAKGIRKIYKNQRVKIEDNILTNTFLCVYNNLKKKTPYSKLLFWFHSNVN